MSKFRDWLRDEYKGFDGDQFALMKIMSDETSFPDTDSLEKMSEYLIGMFARVEFHEALAIMHYHFTFGTR